MIIDTQYRHRGWRSFERSTTLCELRHHLRLFQSFCKGQFIRLLKISRLPTLRPKDRYSFYVFGVDVWGIHQSLLNPPVWDIYSTTQSEMRMESCLTASFKTPIYVVFLRIVQHSWTPHIKLYWILVDVDVWRDWYYFNITIMYIKLKPIQIIHTNYNTSSNY